MTLKQFGFALIKEAEFGPAINVDRLLRQKYSFTIDTEKQAH